MSFLVITPKGKLNECQLTARELTVLQCVAEGHSNKKIATLLLISAETVKTHLKNCYTKLQARNRLEALRKSGLL